MNSKIRLAFQLIILALIIWVIVHANDVENYCPMGGILAFGTKIYQGTMPCNMSSMSVFMAIALLIGALAIGKLFCSFICPVGFLSEWIGKVGKKFKIQFSIPKIADRLLRSIKYFLLFIVLYKTITASELFCRKFDPYFGAATGFGSDTVLLWSVGAVIVSIVGALLVKQFWCRYFCFLGAASNIFVNIWGAAIVVIVYLVLKLVGVHLSLIWLLGGIALMGFLIEAGLFKMIALPIFKITVDQNSCTQCGLCTKACPYDIKVQEYTKVDHPDCMMCTECVTACHEEKAVAVNRSYMLRFLPPILVVALISMGFVLSANYEFTTLEERWGKFDQLESPGIYKQSDVKNVKCWGSSMSLANALKGKKGIYGLDTYAKSHTVVIYYDKEEVSEEDVKQALFSPSRYKIRTFRRYTPSQLTMWEVGIEKLFDRVDQVNLVRALQQNDNIFGVETRFGEPVMAKIFYDADSITVQDIKNTIEVDKIEYKLAGKPRVAELDFECEDEGEMTGTIEIETFKKQMFPGVDQRFNKYSKMDEQTLKVYEIGMPDAGNSQIRRRMQYLISHISADSGIVRYKTVYTERPVARIYFNPEWVDTAKIHSMLIPDSLTYFKRDNTTGKTPNIFKFEYPSKVIDVSEIIQKSMQASSE